MSNERQQSLEDAIDRMADKILQETTKPADIWEYVEQAPEYAMATADLWHWSTNFDSGRGPITLFLDLIGWSDETIGEPLYDLTAKSLGYVELDKLAKALAEYADRPRSVREWIDGLLQWEEA
jgi:hypothetical protein